ncbi:CvpA family protein [Helicobacter baculiformis]|uniref:CvpA family protein n=1 Tax=Helicobacter baculiformis TaxID=427351 RepID=A0ABV7ZGH5_9HELI|nr:CvpA family protein [Helicobacter baculiformis]
MDYIDVALVAVILIVGIRGYYNGLIDEMAGILGIVCGVYLGSRYASNMGAFFSTHVHDFHSPSMESLIGFTSVLAGVWILFLIAGVVVSKAVSFSNLGVIDKALGFVFACAKMYLVFAFLLYGASRFDFMKSMDTYLHANSQFYPTMQEVASYVMQRPEIQKLGKAIQNRVQEVKKNDLETPTTTQSHE